MAQPVSAQQDIDPPQPAPSSAGRPTIIVWSAAALGGLASCSAPLALWFHYGTAVFFEMIAAGIAACF